MRPWSWLVHICRSRYRKREWFVYVKTGRTLSIWFLEKIKNRSAKLVVNSYILSKIYIHISDINGPTKRYFLLMISSKELFSMNKITIKYLPQRILYINLGLSSQSNPCCKSIKWKIPLRNIFWSVIFILYWRNTQSKTLKYTNVSWN